MAYNRTSITLNMLFVLTITIIVSLIVVVHLSFVCDAHNEFYEYVIKVNYTTYGLGKESSLWIIDLFTNFGVIPQAGV